MDIAKVELNYLELVLNTLDFHVETAENFASDLRDKILSKRAQLAELRS